MKASFCSGRRDANWLGRVKTYLKVLIGLSVSLSLFAPLSLFFSVSLSLSYVPSFPSIFSRSVPSLFADERREIERFKSRWRFPRQAPPSLEAHWFLNSYADRKTAEAKGRMCTRFFIERRCDVPSARTVWGNRFIFIGKSIRWYNPVCNIIFLYIWYSFFSQ